MVRAFLALAALASLAACASGPPTYTLTKTIPLGGPDRWDYLTFDPASRHVLIAHSTQTDIVDGIDGRVLGHLNVIHGAHGQAVVPHSAKIYAVNGEDATVTAFDPLTLQPVATIPADTDADGMIYEPKTSRIVVADGDAGNLALIDPATDTRAALVPLGGKPEFLGADGQGAIYANLASTSEVVRVDAATARVTARFAVPDCQSPHGFALDPRRHRLFTTCVNAKLMVLDARSGRVLQSLPIGHGTDAAAFDPHRHRVFSSNGDGTLSVFHEHADGTLTAMATVTTLPGARTMTLDPKTGRLYLITAELTGTRVVPPGVRMSPYIFRPGSTKLLVMDPTGG